MSFWFRTPLAVAAVFGTTATLASGWNTPGTPVARSAMRDTVICGASVPFETGRTGAPRETARTGLTVAADDSVREGVLASFAWSQYRAGRFPEAARAFAQLAAAAPGLAARLDARLMAAQALLEAGAAEDAATQFRLVADSARLVRGLLDARLNDGFTAAPTAALGRALAAQRLGAILWAPEVREGRLFVRGDTVRAIQAGDVTRRLDAIGGPAADPAVRALVWMPGAVPAPVADAMDQLSRLDTRVARASACVEAIAAARAPRIEAAARHTALVKTFLDSLAVTDRQVAAYADSLVKRDSAISVTIANYKVTLLGKIAAVRELAAQNKSSIDSIAGAVRRLGATPAELVDIEQGSAASYVKVADASADALEAGLTRLPVLFQRDSVRLKHAALKQATLVAHAAYDSTFGNATQWERTVAAQEEGRATAAATEQRAALAARDSVEAALAVAIDTALRARAGALRASLDRAREAAAFGAGSATFFALMTADSTRADRSHLTVLRESAIAQLDSARVAYPASPLRPRALLQLGELLTRKADADYATAQRGGASATADHPDYAPAMARFDEFLREFPNDAEADAAAYTLGSLAFLSQKYDDAVHAFERVMAMDKSRFRAEAFFRHGDARFELATRQSGEARRALLAQAAQSYDKAITLSPPDGDIYYLALYKLGWSYYVQAEKQSSDEYRKAVDIFARLVREVDRLPKERQARLALRQEAVDYLATAITQLGSAEEAVRYLATIPDPTTRLLVLRRVARALRDQGEFASAAFAYRAAIDQAPNDSGALETRLDLVDLFQNRMIEPARAQEARLQFADATAPDAAWGKANAARAADAAVIRERILRESGSVALADAKKAAAKGPAATHYVAAAELFARYLREFPKADSAQRVSALEGDALFSAGDFQRAGTAFNRTATQWTGDATLAVAARRNAIVAFDSALARERGAAGAAAGTATGTAMASAAAPSAAVRAIQDSLFAATDRYVAAAGDADARPALIAKGRRAAEGQRWDVMATTFETFVTRWPSDPFAAEARKLVGDARYRQGRYADAQKEWLAAQTLAQQGGRKAQADSIAGVRLAAASQTADSLAKAGKYDQAASEVFTSIASDIGDPTRAADALRNAIEVYLNADSVLKAKGDMKGSREARVSAIAAIEKLTATYPAYQHTLTYAALRPRLLSDIGRPAESVEALQTLIQNQPQWTGRADAMVRVAVLLDSLGRRADAATAYERFSAAYPSDKRAADAQYNAAVIFGEAGDKAGAARGYAAFVQRFPHDSRVSAAQRARVAQLQASGDSTTASAELARLCVGKPSDALASICAERVGAGAFREGMALWAKYEPLRLEIKTRAQLTRAGVEQASAAKQQVLRTMTAQFTRAVASGASEWVAAATFQTGLAQWHYGLFLRDVVLPADLTDAQRDAARRGSAQQAQSYFDAALKTWQALVDKAAAGTFDNVWVAKARAALAGQGIPSRDIPAATTATSDASQKTGGTP